MLHLDIIHKSCVNCKFCTVEPGDPTIGLSSGYECMLEDEDISPEGNCPHWEQISFCSRHPTHLQTPEGECEICITELLEAESFQILEEVF